MTSHTIPLPSPLGTNREKLFLTIHRAPGAAYDSRRGIYPKLAYDDATHGGIEAIKKFISSRLEPEDMAKFERMIAALNDSAQDEYADPTLDPDGDPNRTRTRKQELNEGSGSAMDAMINRALQKQFGRGVSAPRAATTNVVALDQRFPGIGRIGVQPVGYDPNARPRTETNTARLESLAQRYPGFGSIGFA
jgi:hypothetical protein